MKALTVGGQVLALVRAAVLQSLEEWMHGHRTPKAHHVPGVAGR